MDRLSPAVYVGSYEKYNSGCLFGKWLDIEEYDNLTSLKTHYKNNIISAPAIINKFSDSDTKPRGTLLSPPTQAHFNSHSIDLSL